MAAGAHDWRLASSGGLLLLFMLLLLLLLLCWESDSSTNTEAIATCSIYNTQLTSYLIKQKSIRIICIPFHLSKMTEPNRTFSKKPKNRIGRRQKQASSCEPRPPTAVSITDNAINDLNLYMREVVAEVTSPDAVHFADVPPTHNRSDNGYRATRAVKSSVFKKEKAIAKAAALRKSNAALKKQLDSTKSATKLSEHQRFIDSKLSCAREIESTNHLN